MSIRINEIYAKEVWIDTKPLAPLERRPYIWRQSYRGVGAVADCARAALEFYAGPHRPAVVRCICAAERFSAQKWVDPVDVTILRQALFVEHASKTMRCAKRRPTVFATVAAEYAARAVTALTLTGRKNRLERIDDGITAAITAGVSRSACHYILAEWIVRDLIHTATVSHSLRRAAIASVVAGEYEVAADILHGGN